MSLGKTSAAETHADTPWGSARREFGADRIAGASLSPTSWFQFRSFILFLSLLVWFPLAAAVTSGGEPPAAQTKPAPPISPTAPGPWELAAQYERSGHKREAAILYEEVARTNASTRRVLAHRLVSLYVEAGETNKAMKWAREVMRGNPDPQASLAGVYARLGQCREAQRILERELAGNTNSTRAITLRWQLADVCEKEGDTVNSRKLLKEAAEAAKGTAIEATAGKRLTKPSESQK